MARRAAGRESAPETDGRTEAEAVMTAGARSEVAAAARPTVAAAPAVDGAVAGCPSSSAPCSALYLAAMPRVARPRIVWSATEYRTKDARKSIFLPQVVADQAAGLFVEIIGRVLVDVKQA